MLPLPLCCASRFVTARAGAAVRRVSTLCFARQPGLQVGHRSSHITSSQALQGRPWGGMHFGSGVGTSAGGSGVVAGGERLCTLRFHVSLPADQTSERSSPTSLGAAGLSPRRSARPGALIKAFRKRRRYADRNARGWAAPPCSRCRRLPLPLPLATAAWLGAQTHAFPYAWAAPASLTCIKMAGESSPPFDPLVAHCYTLPALRMQQPVMAAAAPQLSLLDLPPDLLIRIGAQLPFAERLRLSLVCRHWRQVCGGPSALWGCVEARIDVADENSEPEDSEHELELKGLVLTAAQDKVTAFRE